MALTLQQVRDLQGLLLSDRLTIKGGEIVNISNLVSALQLEERLLMQQLNESRVVPTKGLPE